MSDLAIERFEEYFQALHARNGTPGPRPYHWQCELAERAINGDWPSAIDLPTGSGKTACLDIAIFALAVRASWSIDERIAPRRIFFCVNRRVIVDEAHERAMRIATAIRDGEGGDGVLADIAAALRQISGSQAASGAPPLDVLELRGGIYRDNRWARSVTQPTIVCTTIDQLGSRLLFRGYGVSSSAAPIQAALIAYDSLILLDEAHISRPFLQTLGYVRRYLDPTKWAEQSVGVKPTIVVPMTATPPEGVDNKDVIRLSEKDREDKSLKNRLTATKPAVLREASDVAKAAVEAAVELANGNAVAIGIIVNRVATAKAVYEQLLELKKRASRERYEKKREVNPDTSIELVIGSMRPIDRDVQAERLRPLVGPNRPVVTAKTSFVVATQCLEVGADYDFDALITECASLDGLRQRFGRLNRAGRAIEAHGVILVDKKAVKSDDDIQKGEAAKEPSKRQLDPIYGNALARTWNWLNEHALNQTVDGTIAKQINFGIDPFDELLKQHGEHGRIPKQLCAPSALLNGPAMLPAYLDFWCQTSPQPVPDPDVSLFIHGERRGEPDVQVCWRADLIEDEHMTRDDWRDVVSLLPPTSAECMSVPISRFKAWLKNARSGEVAKRDDNDLLNIVEAENEQAIQTRLDGVIWRGGGTSKRLGQLTKEDGLHPGDTIVLPVSHGGWDELGHLPEFQPRAASATIDLESDETEVEANEIGDDFAHIDAAERAFEVARDRAALRLHPSLRSHLPRGETFDDLFKKAEKSEGSPNANEWARLCKTIADSLPDDEFALKRTLKHLGKGLRHDPYPDETGFVLTARKRFGSSTHPFIPSIDDGDDELSRTMREQPVLLDDHTTHVREKLSATLQQLPLANLAKHFEHAAQLHDLGKADERFQAMLRRTDRTDAWLLVGISSAVLAKSDGKPLTPTQYKNACERAGLPTGFRHEMLSVQLAEHKSELPTDESGRHLILHLIAAHHGYARPFPPVVEDKELPDIEIDGVRLPHEQRNQLVPPHRVDSGIPDRFWLLTRRFGWWGMAYLEAVLRLADQQASAAEDAGEYENADSKEQAAEVAA